MSKGIAEDVGKLSRILNLNVKHLPKRSISSLTENVFEVGELAEFQSILKEYSVDDVEKLISHIEKDKAAFYLAGKDTLIHNVIFNQPHNTENYSSYYSPKSKFIKKRYKNVGMIAYSFFMSALSGFMLTLVFMGALNSTSVGIGFLAWSISTTLLFIPTCWLMFKHELRKLSKQGIDFGNILYTSLRHSVDLETYQQRVQVIEKEENRKQKILDKLKERHELEQEKKRIQDLEFRAKNLNRELESINSSTVSADFSDILSRLNQAGDDFDKKHESYVSSKKAAPTSAPSAFLKDIEKQFKSLQDTIVSYELDILKAVKYPSFNDITIKEVREMHLLLKESQYAIENKQVEKARRQVNELALSVKAAERMAMRSSWSNMSEKEQSDLQLAENLIKQVNDKGNTDEYRANLYQRLRTVVNRLNSHHVVVPTRAVLVIEEKVRREITR